MTPFTWLAHTVTPRMAFNSYPFNVPWGLGINKNNKKTCVISFTCESAELVRNEYGTYLQYTKQFKYLTIQEDPRGLYSTWFTNGWVGLPNFFRPGNPGSQSCGQTKTDACLHNTSEPGRIKVPLFSPDLSYVTKCAVSLASLQE